MIIALIASISMGTVGVGSQDPSIYIPNSIYSNTIVSITSELTPTVLDHNGVEVYWDDQAEEFEVTINGKDVNDLVTGTNGYGWPSFEGKFTQGGTPTITGCVVPGGSSSQYTVELDLPNEKPVRYTVTNVTGIDPTVGGAQECDCSDNIDLSCTTSKCTNEDECPNTSDENCEWQDTV